jgi:hypothetical protein
MNTDRHGFRNYREWTRINANNYPFQRRVIRVHPRLPFRPWLSTFIRVLILSSFATIASIRGWSFIPVYPRSSMVVTLSSPSPSRSFASIRGWSFIRVYPRSSVVVTPSSLSPSRSFASISRLVFHPYLSAFIRGCNPIISITFAFIRVRSRLLLNPCLSAFIRGWTCFCVRSHSLAVHFYLSVVQLRGSCPFAVSNWRIILIKVSSIVGSGSSDERTLRLRASGVSSAINLPR